MKRTKKRIKRAKRIPMTKGREELIKAVIRFFPDFRGYTYKMTNKELLGYCHPFRINKINKLLKDEQNDN